MDENLAALKRGDVWSPTLSGTQDVEHLTVSWSPSAVLDGFMSRLFQNPVRDEVRAERFYRPIEGVVVLDSSRMQSFTHDEVVDLAERVADKLFRGNESADDVHMGLISYSGNINIGKEYADKLITPESRRLARPGTELGAGKSEERYARQVETLQYHNPALVEDLLAPGGPASDWGMVCVSRPPLTANSDASEYMETVDEPPADSTEGFTLLMGDGRSVGEGTYATEPKSPITYLETAKMNDTQFNGTDVTRLVLFPEGVPVDGEQFDYDKYKNWGGSYWSGLEDSLVSYYFDCPAQPIFGRSHERQRCAG